MLRKRLACLTNCITRMAQNQPLNELTNCGNHGPGIFGQKAVRSIFPSPQNSWMKVLKRWYGKGCGRPFLDVIQSAAVAAKPHSVVSFVSFPICGTSPVTATTAAAAPMHFYDFNSLQSITVTHVCSSSQHSWEMLSTSFIQPQASPIPKVPNSVNFFSNTPSESIQRGSLDPELIVQVCA